MKTKYKFMVVLFAILAFQAIASAYNSDNDARQLYNKAKKHCANQEWQKAVIEFREFMHQYPENQFVDDVQFWYAYSLQRLPGEEEHAFEMFSDLLQRFPQSTWADDAIAHQIQLAEKFAGSGDEKYFPFLNDKLNSENPDIRYRAAISLGKLGRSTALPVLREMRSDENLARLAWSVIERIEKLDQEHESFTAGTPERLQRKEWGAPRFKLYYSLLRKDDGWTWEELKLFGLWHILDDKKFVEYYSFSSEYDKTQWYENYWNKMSEVQEQNSKELRDEFERRVVYSRAHFGAPAEHNQPGYLPYSYMKKDNFRAPWDARGELYIKYGEPEMRYLQGLFTEQWVYPHYNIDFIVAQYQTNIRRNAISDGPITNGIYDNDPLRFDTDFILNEEFRYNVNFQTETFKEYNLNVKTDKHSKSGVVSLEYTIPRTNFESLVLKQQKHIMASVSYSINGSQNEQLNAEKLRIVPVDSDTTDFADQIILNLKPGKYNLKFLLVDLASYKRLDAFREFEVAK